MIYEVEMRFTVTRFCTVEAENKSQAYEKAIACKFESEGPDADVHDWEVKNIKENK